ncbi:MAG TPA: glycosyltransferase [Candidatus Babeliales bacterium]|nr:glycosyltransferase [Candidatus Babeliales bacterium]
MVNQILTQLQRLPVLKNFLTYSFGAIVLRGITALSALVTVRILTTSEFGVLSLLNNFCALFPLFLNLGLRQVFGLEFFHNDTNGRYNIFHNIISLYLSIALPIFGLMLLNSTLINDFIFIGQASKTIILVALCYCFIQFFSELYIQVLRYQRKAFKLTLVQLIAACITIISTGILVFYFDFRILGVLISNFLGISSICIIAFFSYHKQKGVSSISKNWIPQLKKARYLLWLGLPFIPNILFSWILSFGDRWALAYLTNLHTVGIYAFADLSSQVFQMTILLPLCGSYVPYMLKQYADKKEPLKRVEQKNLKTMWYAMGILTLAVTVGSLALTHTVHLILPSKVIAKYAQSFQYVWFILMGNVLFMGTYFSSCYLVFKKRTWMILSTNIVASTSNIALNLLLIPKLNIYGCVLATLTANALFFILTYALLVREHKYLQDSVKHSWYAMLPNLWYTLKHAILTQPSYRHRSVSFTVVITSYNNSQYYRDNLNSVLNQDYTSFNVIYVDDCSSDNTGRLVQNYLERFDKDKKVTLIRNEIRKKKLANLYNAIHSCRDDSIIIELDGDDSLIDNKVLNRLNREYNRSDAWTVYANYTNNPPQLAEKLKIKNWCKKTPRWVIKHKAFRERVWHYSGLRTYYAWLFKQIRKEDLLLENDFIPVFHDAATYYPILEMADEHVSWIKEPQLIRNIDSPLNDFKNIDTLTESLVHNKVLQTPCYEAVKK